MNYYSLQEFGQENVKQLILILMQNLQELKNVKQREKNYVNYSRNFLVFIAKFIIKYGASIFHQIFEMIQPGLINLLLKSEFDKVYSLSTIMDKKIAMYGFCMFMNDFYSILTPETILFVCIQCVKVLESFYKLGYNFMLDNNYDLQENLIFVANSSNKLQNAEIKVIVYLN